jgi:large subunit ribosomal protein L21
MFAVLEIAGKQYKVTANDTITVPTLKEKPGARVNFDRVLLLGGEKEIRIGSPLLDGVTVEGVILGHLREKKVLVFRKKRRKGFRTKRGHRQGSTQVQITSIAS